MAARKKIDRGADEARAWPLRERPGFLIRRLHQIHVALFHQACAEFEMTPLQYSLLSALAERGVADQTTLAADVCLDRTTTTGALKRLAARRLIERAVDAEDRRARACQVTTDGLSLLAKMENAARLAHRQTLARLSKAEQKIFLAFMQRIVEGNADRDDTIVSASDATTQ
jgi:MarR family transcriptional regulator, lower aerobic nicotinate degradation pathway regulator